MEHHTTEECHMKTTIDKYKKLKDMDLIEGAKYDINARVEMIIREVQ